ncbi:hypothetical protein [Leptolyngbya sp. FACHB-16]|uniref:hypothetical protein n=1 Tax=unclassified Leptolyngbya TaxID=2650499 RepID=UPI0016866CCC|nr:hypothetical protein [Leptolyngbya sp. FACHB-16]MBD2156246.1 hypothetical protein [Leptolyngbya sp. FACHB-16]
MKSELENLKQMLAIAIRIESDHRTSMDTCERCWALEKAAMSVSHRKQRERMEAELRQAQAMVKEIEAAIDGLN